MVQGFKGLKAGMGTERKAEMHMSAALVPFQLFSFSLLNPAVDFTTKPRSTRRGMKKEMHMSAALAAFQHSSISAFSVGGDR
jgi:hypothetical protein